MNGRNLCNSMKDILYSFVFVRVTVLGQYAPMLIIIQTLHHLRCSTLPLFLIAAVYHCRVQIKQGQTVLANSGDIYDTTITGGRLGMMVFGQQDVIWSRLEAKCSDRSVEQVEQVFETGLS